MPDDYRAYVDKMARDGTWGDHLTLQAAADAYGVRIMVITRYVPSRVAFVAVTTRMLPPPPSSPASDTAASPSAV